MEEKHEDGGELQTYEVGYHLVPSLSEESLALRAAEIQDAIVKAGGTIRSQGRPAPFVLAYTMRKLRGGRWEKYDTSFFGWFRFEVSPEALVTLRELLDRAEYMVRYLLIKINEAAFAPLASAAHVSTQNGEVVVEPRALVKRQALEQPAEVSEEALDKQLEQLVR